MPHHKRHAAFTLIELLVVISIIGLLSTLAAVGLSSARAKSRDSKRAADLKQIQKALEVSYNPANGYPLTVVAGITLGTAGSTQVLCNVSGVATFVSTAAGCTGGGTVHMALVPANPTPGGANYVYKSTNAAGTATCVSPGPCEGFCISTSLENGLPQNGLAAGSIRADTSSLKNGTCP